MSASPRAGHQALRRRHPEGAASFLLSTLSDFVPFRPCLRYYMYAYRSPPWDPRFNRRHRSSLIVTYTPLDATVGRRRRDRVLNQKWVGVLERDCPGWISLDFVPARVESLRNGFHRARACRRRSSEG